MNQIRNITSYSPTQPAALLPGYEVEYAEVKPHAGLRSVIHCYWQLKTVQKLRTPYCYRVVTDGCMDIFFETSRPDESFVMGFSTSFTQFPLPTCFHYIGVRFLPSSFPLLFNINAFELSNQCNHLKDVLPKLAAVIERDVDNCFSLSDYKTSFDRCFLQQLGNHSRSLDMRFFNALDKIIAQAGNIHIEKDLDTGISPRQLRRLFNFYVGDSPKAFAKIVRFQKFLQINLSSHSDIQKHFYADPGYYDQSHLIKDFKELYGLTPLKAFGQ